MLEEITIYRYHRLISIRLYRLRRGHYATPNFECSRTCHVTGQRDAIGHQIKYVTDTDLKYST